MSYVGHHPDVPNSGKNLRPKAPGHAQGGALLGSQPLLGNAAQGGACMAPISLVTTSSIHMHYSIESS